MPRIRRVCVIGAGRSGLACTVAVAATAGREVELFGAATPAADDAAQSTSGRRRPRAFGGPGPEAAP